MVQMPDLNLVTEKIKMFMVERDWDKYHNSKDILIALVSEIGELAECYRWLNEDQIKKINEEPEKKKKIEEEIADICIYLIILSYENNIDLLKIIDEKIEKNKLKFPIEKFKGKHTNPIIGMKSEIK